MCEHPSVGSPVCSNKTRLTGSSRATRPSLPDLPPTSPYQPTTPTRGPRLLAVLCCRTTHQRKEKVKYRSEVVDGRRKRDVGSEVLYVRDPWRGKERGERRAVERERERREGGGFWACAQNTPSQGTTCTPVTTRRAPSFTSHSNHPIRISTHTSSCTKASI